MTGYSARHFDNDPTACAPRTQKHIKLLTTNISFLRRALVTEEFKSGDFDTGFVGDVITGAPPVDNRYEHLAVWAAVADAFLRDQQQESQAVQSQKSASGVSAWRRYALLGSGGRS